MAKITGLKNNDLSDLINEFYLSNEFLYKMLGFETFYYRIKLNIKKDQK